METQDYDTIYQFTQDYIGTPDTSFDMDDLLADVDAVNLIEIIKSDKFSEDGNLGNYFTEYYNQQSKVRYSSFIENISGTSIFGNIKKKRLLNVVEDYTKENYVLTIGWPLLSGEDIESKASKAFAEAFTDLIWEWTNEEK